MGEWMLDLINRCAEISAFVNSFNGGWNNGSLVHGSWIGLIGEYFFD